MYIMDGLQLNKKKTNTRDSLKNRRQNDHIAILF